MRIMREWWFKVRTVQHFMFSIERDNLSSDRDESFDKNQRLQGFFKMRTD